MRALLSAVLPLLAGCVVMPKTEEVYDRSCQIYVREMSLEAVNVGGVRLGLCQNAGCLGGAAVVGAVAAASAVISGSIVVVGNTVYWLEKKGRCNPPPAAPAE
ncbi:hypothetical protein ACFONG_04225 [Uliginosibacterium paludis]|uniref:Lipoprotein n=1 Tax=Uliginosibacterium paludis TaxID=1615952 RepID=A0ABV2CPJ6_9RHOO